jgi:predicted nuclease of restriction endonuclease-like (RecB) superfamily
MPQKSPQSITPNKRGAAATSYDTVLADMVSLLKTARQTAAHAVNSVMTATYWEIGRRIVEFEQRGQHRAVYGEALLKKLAADLTAMCGRGFSRQNLQQMRSFYLTYSENAHSVSVKSTGRKSQTVSGKSGLTVLSVQFPLSWSHYVRLMGVREQEARAFYEAEALRGGWSIRQLDRQINSMFYRRALLSRNKAAMLTKGVRPQAGDVTTPDEELKDPFVLEFLNLKDEYSERELEEALIRHLEAFLLELGSDFTFVGRQRRLRVGDQWFRVDLVFFHRRLRCLIIIDLKLGKFTHADAGQMHMYLNYAREHWTHPDENPPVGLILCDEKNDAVVRYTLENLPNKVLATEYKTVLPDERLLVEELVRTRRTLETHYPGTKPQHKKR